MSDSIQRSVFKTISWRVVATVITSSIVYLSTDELALAATVGLIDTTIKFVAYFAHERAWNKVDYGKRDDG